MARYFLQVRAEEGTPWLGLGHFSTRELGEVYLERDPHSPEHKQLVPRAGTVYTASRYQARENGTTAELEIYGAYNNRKLTAYWLRRAKKVFGHQVRKWQDRLLFAGPSVAEVKAWFDAQPQEVN